MVVTDMLRCATRGPEVSLHPPLGDQLERGLLVQSATQIMMATSATKRISRMIRCMATSARKFHSPTCYPRIKTAPTLCCGPWWTPLKRERPPTKGKVRAAYFRRKC